MNRLTNWKSFGQNNKWENSPTTRLGAFVKRNLKTKTPVSHSFGRGYGIISAKQLGISFLIPDRDLISSSLIREMAVGKAKTSKEKQIEEDNLKPQNITVRPAQENLEDITKDLIQLTEKEIQTLVEEDANSIQTERGKTWLEQSGYALRPCPEDKEMLLLTKKVGNTEITVRFKKDYEDPTEDDDNEAELNEEAEEGLEEETEIQEKEEDVIKDSENEGQEQWIRSGDELPDRKDFPQKHSVEIDIRLSDKEGKPKGKLHIYGFAGLDDRLYINEMISENDLVGESEQKESYVVFDDLSDPMQDRFYDYLDELGVDDRLAHFVKTTVAREKKGNDITFLTNFKELLKA